MSIRIADGDRLTIEGLSLDALYTPGHTDDSYCFLCGDRVFVNGAAIFLKSGAAKFPILAGWRSARGVIGASVFWRTATTLQG